jgi:hypothetical protein
MGIPESWEIGLKNFRNPDCSDESEFSISNGRNFVCLTSDDYSASAYWYGLSEGRKRSKRETECGKPHTFVLRDGHKYDITNMADEQLLELVEFAKNGSTAADVPEGFTAFSKV